MCVCVCVCVLCSSSHSVFPLFPSSSIWTSLTTSIMQKVIMSECTLRHGRPLCADGCSNEVSKPSWQAQTLPMQIKHSGKFIAPRSQIEYLSFCSLQLSLFFLSPFSLDFPSCRNNWLIWESIDLRLSTRNGAKPSQSRHVLEMALLGSSSRLPLGASFWFLSGSFRWVFYIKFDMEICRLSVKTHACMNMPLKLCFSAFWSAHVSC